MAGKVEGVEFPNPGLMVAPTVASVHAYAQQCLGEETQLLWSRAQPWSTVVQLRHPSHGVVWWGKGMPEGITVDYRVLPDVQSPLLPSYHHVDDTRRMWIIEDYGPLLETCSPPVVLGTALRVAEELPSIHVDTPRLHHIHAMKMWDVDALTSYLEGTALPPRVRAVLAEQLKPLEGTPLGVVNTDLHAGNISHEGVLFDWSDAFRTYHPATLTFFLRDVAERCGVDAARRALSVYADAHPAFTEESLRELVVPASVASFILRYFIFDRFYRVTGNREVGSYLGETARVLSFMAGCDRGSAVGRDFDAVGLFHRLAEGGSAGVP